MQNAKHVSYNSLLCCIECSGCGDEIPLCRKTRHNQEAFTLAMERAKMLHGDCGDKPQQEAKRAVMWRAGMIRATHAPDRLVYSA